MSCQQCSGCAFKDGAAANREPNNRLKGLICALAGIPFYCHNNLDWEKGNRAIGEAVAIARNQRKLLELGVSKAAIMRATLPLKDGQTIQVCEGWKAQFQDQYRRDWFRNPEINKLRRMLGEHALRMLDQFLDKKSTKPEKDHAHAALLDAIKLFRADLDELHSSAATSEAARV